jgi:hypothetical protein
LSNLYTTGEVKLTLTGDYNGDGMVEQADLDLVLLNWGEKLGNPSSAGWFNDLPSGAVDQQELDKVLLGWGNAGFAADVGSSAGVPEPGSFVMAGITVCVLLAIRRLQRAMQAILNDRSGAARFATTLFALVAFTPAAQAHIFQWEYVNPAAPSQGRRQSETLAPDGAGVDAMPGADLSRRDLTKAYLIPILLTPKYAERRLQREFTKLTLLPSYMVPSEPSLRLSSSTPRTAIRSMT